MHMHNYWSSDFTHFSRLFGNTWVCENSLLQCITCIFIEHPIWTHFSSFFGNTERYFRLVLITILHIQTDHYLSYLGLQKQLTSMYHMHIYWASDLNTLFNVFWQYWILPKQLTYHPILKLFKIERYWLIMHLVEDVLIVFRKVRKSPNWSFIKKMINLLSFFGNTGLP